MKGQVLLVLLLVMAVGLGVGISIIARSLTDVSTSSKAEQSQRAFSAAEAGIEKALQGTCVSDPCVSFSDNSATATTQGGVLLPTPGQALEFPPVSKESFAHFWLADPMTVANYYKQTSIEVYWGDPNAKDAAGNADIAAIELTFIYYDNTSGTYKNSKYYYDSVAARRFSNNFTDTTCDSNGYTTGLTGGAKFHCKQTVSSLHANLKILRVRLLYNYNAQPVALKPITTGCSDGCSLPPQARLIISTGSSGVTKRTIQLFSIDRVVPFFFDFAIFSAGDITK